MNASWILAMAVGVFALAFAALGLGLRRSQRERRADEVLQAALRARQTQASDGVDAGAEKSRHRRWLEGLESLGRRFSGSRLEAALLASEDRLLLDRVRWNTASGAAVFVALRVLFALLLMVVAAVVLRRPSGLEMLLISASAAALGLLLPKLLLGAWARRLRKGAAEELPLLIDLLRLLQGVGMSIDQSLQMLGEKLRIALPVLGRELHEANAAYMRGRSREQSLQRLSASFDDDDLRSLVQLILQVHQHGGAVQEPLRQFGDRLRERRRMELKEKVGKLSVKMTVVMMLTLLPALMLVLSGPAIVALASAMAGMK